MVKFGANLEAVAREDAAGASQREIHRLTRMLAVLSAVNSAAVTVYMSARRRLKRSVKNNM